MSIDVIGRIWWPMDAVCAYSYPLRDYDIENMRGDDGKIARREIEDWLNQNAGDFSEIIDFRASINSAEYGWKSEESEWTFFDCMYGSEDAE